MISMSEDHSAERVEILPVHGIGELRPGDDLAEAIVKHALLQDGDVLVVTSKAVSKVEGRLISLGSTDPVERETVRQEAIKAETVRVVAQRHAAHDRDGDAGELALDQVGRGGDLVGDRDHGDVQRVPVGVDHAARVEQRAETGDADSRVGDAFAPGAAHRVADDHAEVDARALADRVAQCGS